MDMDFEACRRAFQTRDPRFDGRIFGAVKSTGIYCRPVCPARTPRCENVVSLRRRVATGTSTVGSSISMYSASASVACRLVSLHVHGDPVSDDGFVARRQLTPASAGSG